MPENSAVPVPSVPFDAAGYKYFAFISYSRKDNKAAKWLQRHMEWFHVPVKLVESDRRPHHSRYLRPIYRDKTHLEVDHAHYWENIQRALDASRFLIILCSPNSADSVPVDKEVRHFLSRRQGSLEAVIPVVLRGHLHSQAEDKCLCPILWDQGSPLRDRNLPTMIPEPGDSEEEAWEAGFISIACYVLKVQRESLKDHLAREEHRRVTKARGLAALFAVLAAVAIGVGIRAYQSAEEARVQKGNAEVSERRAKEQEKLAIERAEEAKFQKGVAETNEQRAKAQEKIAIDNEQKAKAQEKIAVDNLAEATRQRLEAEKQQKIAATQTEEKIKASEAEKVARSSALNSHIEATHKNWGNARAAFDVRGTNNARAGFAFLAEALRHNTTLPADQQLNVLHQDAALRLMQQASASPLPLLQPLTQDELVEEPSFSGDSCRCVVFTSSDKTQIQVWDVYSGKPVGEPILHDGRVSGAKFNADGTRLVTACEDQYARVWDVATGIRIGKSLPHDFPVRDACFSRDGTHIITACAAFAEKSSADSWDSATNTAQVWDFAGKKVGRSHSHTGRISPESLSHSGKLLLTFRDKGSVDLWDLSKEDYKGLDFLFQEGTIISAKFSPDDSSILTIGTNTATVWDTKTRKKKGEPLTHSRIIMDATFNPDGTQIATASWDRTARIWDATTGKPVGEPLRHEDGVNRAEFSPEGMRLVTVSRDKTVRIWNGSLNRVGEPLRHSGDVFAARFSPDGSRVVTMTIGSMPEKDQIYVWNAGNGAPFAVTLQSKIPSSFKAGFSPSGKQIITFNDDNIARVWDSSTGRPAGKAMVHDDQINCAAYSADGNHIVTASNDKTARLWNAATNLPTGAPMLHESRVRWASFNAGGTLLVTGGGDEAASGNARIWGVPECLQKGPPLQHATAVTKALFSPDGSRILTLSANAPACLWDVSTGSRVRLLNPPSPRDNREEEDAYDACFSPDGRLIATASTNGVRLWNARDGLQTSNATISLNRRGNCVSFSPDGAHLVTGTYGNDAATRVWEVATGKPVTESFNHGQDEITASFSPDGTKILSSSDDDATVRLWHVKARQPLGPPLLGNFFTRSASFSPDGRKVLFSHKEAAQVFDMNVDHCVVSPEDLINIAGQQVSESGQLIDIPLEQRLDWADRVRTAKPDPANPWLTILQWYVRDPQTRTIQPFSNITPGEHIQQQIQTHLYLGSDDAFQPYAQAMVQRYQEVYPAHPLVLLINSHLPKDTAVSSSLRRLALARLGSSASELSIAAEFLVQTNDFETAMSLADRALLVEPANAIALRAKAAALTESGKSPESLPLRKQLCELEEATAEDFRLAGRLSSVLSELSITRALFTEARKRFPSEASLWEDEGWALWLAGERATAQAVFLEGQRLMLPTKPRERLLVGLAVSLWSGGGPARKLEAIEAFKAWIENREKDSDDQDYADPKFIKGLSIADSPKEVLLEVQAAAFAKYPELKNSQ